MITASLIGQVDWVRSAPDSWKKQAYEDLKRQLSRDYSGELPEPVKMGMDFEKTVYETVNKIEHEEEKIKYLLCSDEFKKLLITACGGRFQKVSKDFIIVDDVEYCLYGKIDIYKKDLIIDIKTTTKEPTPEKYLKTAQHMIYCYNENIDRFLYYVVIMSGKKILGTEKYWYDSPGREELQTRLEDRIRSVMGFIEQNEELAELYHTTFCK